MEDSDLENKTADKVYTTAANCTKEELMQLEATERKDHDTKTKHKVPDLLFGLDDSPPWHLNLLLALQHYIILCPTTLVIPIMVCNAMCVPADDPARGMINSTVLFLCGITTLLQTTIGTRLPIIQGTSISFLSATFAILQTPALKCPPQEEIEAMINVSNGTFDTSEIWKTRARELQGAFIIASVFEILLGVSGAMALLQRYLGPLTIAPVITLIGLSVIDIVFEDYLAKHLGIGMLALALTVLFSQYLENVKVPCFTYKKNRGCVRSNFEFFQLFSIITSMGITWILCAILTSVDALGKSPEEHGYWARTDIRYSSIAKSPWFRVPYPGQWGAPTFSIAAGVGMMAGVVASVLESIGDYYACARICEVPPPPKHAVSRGITVEGFGVTLSGLWGGCFGNTSYSSHIGVIAITKVASRNVIQITGVLMILFGCFGKFGAVFATMPEPIIGASICVILGLITAIGVANLQYVDINSTRNLFVFGFSLFMGLSLPIWLKKNPDVVNTGSQVADQIIMVLGSTGMFVGGAVGFFFDNTIPGTLEERGFAEWINKSPSSTTDGAAKSNCYDLHPSIMNFIQHKKLFNYIPLCPTFLSKSEHANEQIS